ncbi:MAG: hypothetical protein M3R62_13360, partial [Acidobacteriota bacterium]|nr:hypothetical protein [Acidobacteriota bacterium]
VAGVVYAFVPWRLAQLPHVQFQWGAFLALLLLFLLRTLESGRRRDVALFGLFFAWNALSNVHYAVFSGLLVLLVLAHGFLTRERAVFFPRARAVLLALAIAVLAVVPFYIPYARASRTYGMVRGEDEIAFFSGRPVDFLTAGPQNKLYAPWTQRWAHAEGDFFPGLTALLLAGLALRRLWGPAPERATPAPLPRRRIARGIDILIGGGLLLAAAATLLERPALGPLKLRDPGRIVALAGALAIVRLAVAFPRWSRYTDLGDFARRTRAGRVPLLFLSIAGLGVLIAFGMHTPFYRFLVQSGGPLFRAIRVPSRGIVLFDLALGVFAAWGLARGTAGRSARGRTAAVAAALLLLTFEYRAFPIEIGDVREQPAPVYRWLRTVALRGGAVEWPMNVEVEPEHVFRAAAHWKPIVNGYSGFGPPRYHALVALFAAPRIPDSVWAAQRELGASLLIFHASEMSGQTEPRKYLGALRRGISLGKASPLGVFPRPETPLPDLVFRLAGAPPFPAPVALENALVSSDAALAMLFDIEGRLTAPFGALDRPREGETISAGFWSYGWALDDSGVARVTVAADAAPPAECVVGQAFPGVADLYPRYPDAGRPGFGCSIPPLSPGRHVLRFEITGRDGGKTVLLRPIRAR